MKIKQVLLGAIASFSLLGMQAQNSNGDVRTLIVFFDGLRPDYITAEGMPRLYAFRQQASYGTHHHSVFPTVTRVNSSSYSTGSYPATHGLMGNTVYFPEVDKLKGLNTGDAAELRRIDSATHGHLLTTTASLGQVLQQAGKRFMVFSSGSTGQALLQNHTVSGGMIINPSMILPESSRKAALQGLEAPPAGGKADAAGHAWVTDALLVHGLVPDGPLVNAVWFSEPDGAAHQYGIGSPQARAALKLVDHQFGRILDSLSARHLDSRTNILISTDHGFATYVGKQKLPDFLIRQGLKRDTLSDDVVVAEGAIYVKGHDPKKIQDIVTALQGEAWAGPLFTKGDPGSLKGSVPGTVSFEAVHWNHTDRAADILVASNWNDSKNREGWAGASFSTGVAGHGGLSPYEVQIPLMAWGPSFKKAFTDTLPTSNVDLVPTVLHIHHLPVPAGMEGRILQELLTEKTAAGQPPVPHSELIVESAATRQGTYRVELHRTILGNYRYVDFATVKRSWEGTVAQ